MCAPWVRNEFLEADVNKFSGLTRRGTAVATLGDATQGRPMLSARFRDLYRPHGMGHELRAVLADGTGTWGYLTLVREAGARDFDGAEQALVSRLASTIASAVRRSHAGPVRPAAIGPGVITVSPEGDILQVTDGAVGVLDEVCAASILAVAASALGLSPYTVRDHVSSIFTKVGCRSRGELVHALFGTDVVTV